MCQMSVASRRITATRAVFEPRRFRTSRYQSRICLSFRSTCRTICPNRNRTWRLPCLVIEPIRWVLSPELPQPIRQAPEVGQALRTREAVDLADP